MRVVFLKKFSKDLDKINRPKDLQGIAHIIQQVEKVNKLEEIPGVKKLVGFDDAYRIRSGHFRIGVFVNDQTVEFARVAHRKDIYKIFP